MDWKPLENVPPEDLGQLLAIARRRKFARGEVVFHRGDPADSLHLVRSGRFAVRVVTAGGDAALLSLCGPGEAFGELALLGEGPTRSATVTATEAAETRAVYRADFERLRRTHPSVDSVLLGLLAERVRRLSEHLVEAYYVHADTRVLRRLLEVAEFYRDDGEPSTTVPLTQEDIAALAGTSRATVNRVLREEEERGTVEIGRGRSTIHDPDGLARRVHRRT